MISSLRLQCCQAAQALLENKSLLANGSSEYSSWTLTLLKLGSYEVINSYLCQWVDSLEQQHEKEKKKKMLEEGAEKGAPICVEADDNANKSKVRHKLTQRKYRVRKTLEYNMKKMIESEVRAVLRTILKDVAIADKARNQVISDPKFVVSQIVALISNLSSSEAVVKVIGQ